MNRNKISEILELSKILANETNANNIASFIIEILTLAEVETLSKRWQILKMLNNGKKQREIARDLKVSLCKVTRGSQILKDKKSIIGQYLNKGEIQ